MLVEILKASPDGARSPTLRELTRDVGKSAESNILRALDELETKTYIERDRVKSSAAQARGIWLTKRALGWLRLNGHNTSRYIRAAISPDEIRIVPLLGDVAAGNPISPEAYIPDEDVEEYVPLPSRHLPIGDVFLLKVVGDSMTGDGILDGDQVIMVPYQGTPKGQGEMVIALVDNDATVKRLYSDGDPRVRSVPAPRLIAHDEQDRGAHGSKINRMRTSLRPRDPGRSSFRFAIFKLAMVSTSGRPSTGPERLSV